MISLTKLKNDEEILIARDVIKMIYNHVDEEGTLLVVTHGGEEAHTIVKEDKLKIQTLIEEDIMAEAELQEIGRQRVSEEV